MKIFRIPSTKYPLDIQYLQVHPLEILYGMNYKLNKQKSQLMEWDCCAIIWVLTPSVEIYEKLCQLPNKLKFS